MKEENDGTSKTEKDIKTSHYDSHGEEMKWEDIEGSIGAMFLVGLAIIILALGAGLYDYLASGREAIIAFGKVLFTSLIYIGAIVIIIAIMALIYKGMRK